MSFEEDIGIVADNILDVQAVADNMNNIDLVKQNEGNINLAVANENNIDIVAENTININLAVSNMDDIQSVTTEPLKTAIINAEGNAEDAELSASLSELESWKAEAQRLTAYSYAVEPEDFEVKEYQSNGDGTFSYNTLSGIYSALHYANKAGENSAGQALYVSYDDTTSGLGVFNVQSAIDSLDSTLDNLSQEVGDNEDAINTLIQANTANQILSKLRTVDGSGSGLDADLFDGLTSSQFVLTTKVSSSVTSSSTTNVANSNAVKIAYDKAIEALADSYVQPTDLGALGTYGLFRRVNLDDVRYSRGALIAGSALQWGSMYYLRKDGYKPDQYCVIASDFYNSTPPSGTWKMMNGACDNDGSSQLIMCLRVA